MISFRDLCQKLHLKAESQEIDRIIEGFSARYYECNPGTVFGTPGEFSLVGSADNQGVVHTVTGAMLMLNTDLHIADLTKHMSRADFVRNSMRAIQESVPLTDRGSTPDLVRDDSSSSKFGQDSNASVTPSSSSMRAKTPTIPLNGQRSASAPVVASPAPGGPHRSMMARQSSATMSSFSYSKAWESEAENALKVGWDARSKLMVRTSMVKYEPIGSCYPVMRRPVGIASRCRP